MVVLGGENIAFSLADERGWHLLDSRQARIWQNDSDEVSQRRDSNQQHGSKTNSFLLQPIIFLSWHLAQQIPRGMGGFVSQSALPNIDQVSRTSFPTSVRAEWTRQSFYTLYLGRSKN